jgi:hypothetical protein
VTNLREVSVVVGHHIGEGVVGLGRGGAGREGVVIRRGPATDMTVIEQKILFLEVVTFASEVHIARYTFQILFAPFFVVV